MSTLDEAGILQMPGTFMARLGTLLGQPVVIYLRGVHAHMVMEVPGQPCPGPCPPFVPPTEPGMTGPAAGSPGVGPGFGGPPLTPGVPPGGGHVTPLEPFAGRCEPAPGPRPGMGTTVLNGTLVFAGADYLVLRAAMGARCVDFLVPYMAVGMIVLGGMVV